jgi:dihydroorotase
MPSLSVERLVELFSTQPRKIFNLPLPRIDVNERACLSLFLENQKWTFERKDLKSRSENTPFIGKELTGKPIGIINKNQLFINQ